MSLDISNPDIKTALFNLKDNGKHLQWVLLGFVPKVDTIKVKEEGQGFEELIESLSDGSIFWCWLRWDSGGLPKFVYISWCGEGVTGVRKAKFMNHSQDMEKFFSTNKMYSHVSINARREEDLKEKDIENRVGRAMGVSYDKAQGDKSRFQQTSEGAGATFKNVKKAHKLVTKGSVKTKKTEVEVKPEQREAFWNKQKQADEQRRKEQQAQVPEARAEQGQLVKQREKYWKQHQAKGHQVKRTAENPDYQVPESEREKFWNAQQQNKGGTQRAAETPDYQVSENERQAYWDKVNAEKQVPKSTNNAPPPGKVAKNAPPKAVRKAPPAKLVPSGPSPDELARQRAAEEERQRQEAERRRQEEEAAAAAAAAEEEQWEEEEQYVEEEGQYEEQYEEEAVAEEQYEEQYEEEAWEEEAAPAEEQYEEEAWEEEEQYEEEAWEEEGGWEEGEEAYVGQCQAIGDWPGGNEGDCALTTGDIIDIMDNTTDPEGWWTGYNETTGVTGSFPSNYTRML